MSDRTAAVGFRVLGARARLLGTGDPDALQNVNTTNLPDGSLCWVSDQGSIYVLHKDSADAPVPPTIITPGSGPGRWIQLVTGGSGGGIPMPDGTVLLPEGANFTNELTLGIYRPAAGKIGVASGNFLGLTMGDGTATNVDPLSPSVVRYVVQGFNRPLTGGENETTFAYVKIDPSAGDPQQAALYVDITGAQLDTYGPAIKVVHAGHGDAIYVAQFANGSAYEAASFADGSRGYISTVQIAGTPNSTLFNALWDSASVPNFGLFYADLSTANALTIRKRAATAVDGLTQIRIIEETGGRERFATYNDGSVLLQGAIATAGGDQASPELRIYGSIWDGAVAQVNGFIVKEIPNGDNGSILAIYNVTPAGTTLFAQFSNNNTGSPTPDTDLNLFDGRIRIAEIFSTFHIDHVINGGNLALRLDTPGGANATTLQQLLLKTAANNFTAKDVAQGAADSAGVGFTALVVPNDGDVDTTVDAGDFGTFVNLGTAPTVSVAAGSTCRRGQVTITPDAAGGGPAPGWSFVLTFPVAFVATPFAICVRNDTNNPPVVTSMQVSGLATTTTLAFSELGSSAPSAGVAYQFTWMVME